MNKVGERVLLLEEMCGLGQLCETHNLTVDTFLLTHDDCTAVSPL
jgi:hypothetical protein